MKEKILSLLFWFVVALIISTAYLFFTNSNTQQNTENIPPQMEITDERLEQMAERFWVDKDELKERIENWEDLRSILWENWWFRNWSWAWFWPWSGNLIWTWSNINQWNWLWEVLE